MINLDYQVVDAFASEPFQGNPAAVVLGGDELTDSQMQQIAAEFNLSETVFILRATGQTADAIMRLRWFTPQCEVSFCGHATLAAVHAYRQRAIDQGVAPFISAQSVGVQCAAGNLTVKLGTTSDGCRLFWLSMPGPDTQGIDFPEDLLFDSLQLRPDTNACGPVQRTRDRDVILFLSDREYVQKLSPDMNKLERISRQLGIRGVSVASTNTGDSQVACISRFFAPAAGIPEDPVTGSVHGPLAALLIERSHVPPNRPDHWSFLCRQVPRNGRLGDVHVRASRQSAGLAIEVGGSCVTVMAGRIAI